MRKPKIAPARVWRVPQSHLPGALPDQPSARPAPDYFRVLRGVEDAMRSLPLWIESAPIESYAEKYADLLYRQIGAAAPMTAKQTQDHLAEISEGAWALAQALTRAGPDIEAQLDAFRATSLDRIGIKTPSFGAMQTAVQWIAEAAEAAARAKPAPAKLKGPLRKVFAQEVSQLAAEDYYSLTRLKPTATKRVKGGGFLDFLRKIFEAVEVHDTSVERFAADAVEWFEKNFEAVKTDSADKRFAVAWFKCRELNVEE